MQVSLGPTAAQLRIMAMMVRNGSMKQSDLDAVVPFSLRASTK